MKKLDHIIKKHLNTEELQDWERKLIDERLDFIKKYPDQLIPIEDFISELNKSQ